MRYKKSQDLIFFGVQRVLVIQWTL